MTELDIACEKLRKAIRNEQKTQDMKTTWQKMALTSSQKREYAKKWTSDIYGRK